MQNISFHILDIVENSLRAHANLITIKIEEYLSRDKMFITISDNGKGMTPNFLAQVTNPFITSRSNRRVGLGLSLMQSNARHWGGDLKITSKLNKGTIVKILFQLRHIDRPPLGEWGIIFWELVFSQKATNFIYYHRVENKYFKIDTRKLHYILGIQILNNITIIKSLTEQTCKMLTQINSDHIFSTIK